MSGSHCNPACFWLYVQPWLGSAWISLNFDGVDSLFLHLQRTMGRDIYWMVILIDYVVLSFRWADLVVPLKSVTMLALSSGPLLSMESLCDSEDKHQFHTTVLWAISSLSSPLNWLPNIVFMVFTMSSGSHVGSVHAEILVWEPLTMNGFPVVMMWSICWHTGQHHLDTPMICPTYCIINCQKDLGQPKQYNSLWSPSVCSCISWQWLGHVKML